MTYRDLLGKFLDSLDPSSAAMVRLRLRGCAYQEIATELGCSLRTVQRQLAAARGVLQRLAGEPVAGRGGPQGRAGYS